MSRTRIILYILIVLALPVLDAAAAVNYAAGLYGGIAPSLGGNLSSFVQASSFGSPSGLDGMDRSSDTVNTGTIDRLTGFGGGFFAKVLFMDYYQVRLAGNYTRSVLGGTGTSVYNDGGVDRALDCEYSFLMYDVPLTIGISIPFWKDIKIMFSCGVAYAYANYRNSFKSTTFSSKGEFTGWGLPLVILLEGEYFLNDRIAVSSSLAYYRGSSKVLKDQHDSDSTDYARLDLPVTVIMSGLPVTSIRYDDH